MSNHLSLRSGNPVLKANTFIQRQTTIDTGMMTITGTVNKTALGLLLLMTTAIFTWNMSPTDKCSNDGWDFWWINCRNNNCF